MEAPFVYGRKVGREHFADREDDIERLKLIMLSGQNVILYSPRRYGKSSLIQIALDELGEEVYPVWVDCYGVLTRKELAERISSAALRSWRDRAEVFVKKFFRSVRPKLVIGDSIELEFGWSEEESALREVLRLPEMIARERKKRVVVVFDEFQEVAGLGDDILAKMRSEFQNHGNVTYVFIGSRVGMMRKIFQSPSSPFYNFGMHLVLKRIPPEKFRDFIIRKFGEAGLRVSSEAVDAVLEITKGHPHYTQMLCYRLWLMAMLSGRNSVGTEDVEGALSEVLTEASEFFEEIWDSLTMNQRRLLRGLAEGERDLYSKDFLVRYGFENASTVQATLRALLNKELVIKEDGRYLFENPLFERWVRGLDG
ncbi:ATP-binding protein [Thermococcus sp. JdF3]|uniref:AAA family ATPase n=1 Tax=Thermococcus sp. JdF3 TaxID=1638258 RepID=UPI001438C84A|nr:ATP-binding protein [Thermococcus sp. JdF3]NJE01781.1 ATP-binding protein [Thermococcus sp. JdF3]